MPDLLLTPTTPWAVLVFAISGAMYAVMSMSTGTVNLTTGRSDGLVQKAG
jgi:hypothetical protein